MLRQRLRQTLGPNEHGLMWRLANVALFVFALVAAVAVMLAVFYAIGFMASEGS
jgi:hypothetical protein